MRFSYFLYNLLGMGLHMASVSLLWLYLAVSGQKSDMIRQRLGCYSDSILKKIQGRPRIWIHAVSVGEVRAAGLIIDDIKKTMPRTAVILSVTTPHGYAFAKKNVSGVSALIYTPVDFYFSIKRALASLKPDLLAIVETEIWPNWLIQAHRMGVKTVFLNGRISNRTINTYLKIKSLIHQSLKNVDAFSMISQADRERIIKIGAPEQKVFVNGNAKFDIQANPGDLAKKQMLFKRFALDEKTPVFIAGSTRRSEEGIVLDVFVKLLQQFPDTILIIAPRHVERSEYVAQLVKSRGLQHRMRTDLGSNTPLRTQPVIILDTIGELRAAYGLATLVFCGGSLEPLGGQNLLEPAAWGKPVLYGPFMDDFMDARNLLEKTGGGIQVNNGAELFQKALQLIKDPELISKKGAMARLAADRSKGAANRHSMVVRRLL